MIKTLSYKHVHTATLQKDLTDFKANTFLTLFHKYGPLLRYKTFLTEQIGVVELQ